MNEFLYDKNSVLLELLLSTLLNELHKYYENGYT